MGRRTFSPPYGSRAEMSEPQELSVRDVLGLVIAERDRRDRNSQWEMENARLQEAQDARLLADEAQAEKDALAERYKGEVAADGVQAMRKLMLVDPSSPDFDSDIAAIMKDHSHGMQDKQVADILQHKMKGQAEFRSTWFPDGTGDSYDARKQFEKLDPETGRRYYDQAARDLFRSQQHELRYNEAIEQQKKANPDMDVEGVLHDEKGMPRLRFKSRTVSKDDIDTQRAQLTVERENANQAIADAAKPLMAAKLLQQKQLPYQDTDGKFYRWDAATKTKKQISEEEYKPYADAVKLLGVGADANKIVEESESRVKELRTVRNVLDKRISSLALGDSAPTTNTVAKPTLSGVDAQAAEWAKANPNDPRAAEIKKRLNLQ